MTVKDIFAFLEELAPFELQESYDNSGFLVGDKNAVVTGVCLCLDITRDVIAEAKAKGANLIISHHPVIFKPLSGIWAQTAAYELVRSDINAICAHTNFDAEILPAMMLDLIGAPRGELPGAMSADELAKRCKTAFNSAFIRYVDGGKPIRKIAVCPGSGGSRFDEAVEAGCDAFVTGEMKHSAFVEAKNAGITLVEAGHFHTEIFFCDYVKKQLAERFSGLSVFAVTDDFYGYV
jgi:dinuclear metal center YbgI/SA1388 family protein